MKCDGCGRQFSARDAETATRNEAIRPAGRWAYTKIVVMTLCPDCAASRAVTQRFVYWFVALVAAGTFLAVLANWLWK